MKKDMTELAFILDKSDTIGGFNAMLKKQKALDGECRITTVLFDNRYELLHDTEYRRRYTLDVQICTYQP